MVLSISYARVRPKITFNKFLKIKCEFCYQNLRWGALIPIQGISGCCRRMDLGLDIIVK